MFAKPPNQYCLMRKVGAMDDNPKPEPKFPVVYSQRLRLDEISDQDVHDIYALFTSAEGLEYYDLERLVNEKQALEIIHEFRARFYECSGIRWAIRTKKELGLLGTCGLKSWNPTMGSIVLGYDLLPKYWGNGYATEAIHAIIKAALSDQLPWGPIHRIEAETVPGNARSESVLCKLGFKEEGLRRDAGFWKGRYHNLKCFGLLSNEFEQK